MPEEPLVLAPRRAAGWAAVGTLIVAAVVLYFMYGRTVPPLEAEPPAESSTAP